MDHRCLDKLLISSKMFLKNQILVIIGNQNEYFKSVLEPIYISERLEKKVYFIPHVPISEIMSYVASADLGVVIYKNMNRNNYYCAPTKLYEFTMAKVPIAACNFPEIEDFLYEYPLGVTFDPEDPTSIANAINFYFSSGEADNEYHEEIFRHARQRLNWENESAKYINLIKCLLSEKD